MVAPQAGESADGSPGQTAALESDVEAAHAAVVRADGTVGRVPMVVEDSVLLTGTPFLPPPQRVAIVGHFGPVWGQPGASDRLVLLPDGDLPARGVLLTELRVTRSHEALAGSVRTGSPADALAYVRLFTSPATAHCLRQTWYEVMPLSVLEREASFGTDLNRLSLRRGGGHCGVLTDDQWLASGLDEPVAESLPDGSVRVVRWLYAPLGSCEFRSDRNEVIRVEEQVSPDGQIARVLGARRELPRQSIRLSPPPPLE